MLDELPMVRGVTVLDLGSGNGFPLFELARRFGASSRFVGLDAWAAAMPRAELKRRVLGDRNITLLLGDGAKLPLADASFDLIVSNVGVNNFSEPEVAMAECGRVAKPGAVLALTTNPRGHMAALYDTYREVLDALGLGAHTGALDAQEAHRATEPMLRGLLATGGFETVRVVKQDFRLRHLDGSALLRDWLVRIGFLDGWRSVIPDEDEERVFAALEEALNERARESGELSMTVPMIYMEGRREPR